ncbi:uncharacterized protein UHOR_16679 [Ustilago hordei]|uniref:Uncharacterized protein n=1 Tax=Ustilago hordei TaxID=120017 RepID=I2G663_USTHO|nr:uncharacterized protein UHOR_16679 [Ustilago hordei]
MEHITESTLLYEASRICMFNADVCKLAKDINEHWAKAEAIGYNLTQVLKIKMLIDQAKFMMVHNNCIMNLQDNGQGMDYDVICAALMTWQQDQTIGVTARTLKLLQLMDRLQIKTLTVWENQAPMVTFCPKNPNSELQTPNDASHILPPNGNQKSS